MPRHSRNSLPVFHLHVFINLYFIHFNLFLSTFNLHFFRYNLSTNTIHLSPLLCTSHFFVCLLIFAPFSIFLSFSHSYYGGVLTKYDLSISTYYHNLLTRQYAAFPHLARMSFKSILKAQDKMLPRQE